jgi:thiosulfate dehydrogenase [quinone] large subunit
MNRSEMQVSENANTLAITLVRIVVGLFFVVFGEYKVFGTAFTLHGGFESYVAGMLHGGETYPWMAPVIERVVLVYPHPMAFLVAYGELLIGLSLVFGMLTRLASVFGLLLMILIWLSGGYPGAHADFWRYWGASLDWSVFALCFVALIVGRPEERWSLRASRFWLRRKM